MFVFAEKQKPSTLTSTSKLRFAHALLYILLIHYLLLSSPMNFLGRTKWSTERPWLCGRSTLQRVLRIACRNPFERVLTWLNRFCLPSTFNNSNTLHDRFRQHYITCTSCGFSASLSLHRIRDFCVSVCFFFFFLHWQNLRKPKNNTRKNIIKKVNHMMKTHRNHFIYIADDHSCNEFFIQYFWRLVRGSPHLMFWFFSSQAKNNTHT